MTVRNWGDLIDAGPPYCPNCGCQPGHHWKGCRIGEIYSLKPFKATPQRRGIIEAALRPRSRTKP